MGAHSPRTSATFVSRKRLALNLRRSDAKKGSGPQKDALQPARSRPPLGLSGG